MTKKNLKLTGLFAVLGILASGLALATERPGGSDIGNGGDLVPCTPSAKNLLRGVHTLDYLLTLGPDNVPLTPDAQVVSLDRSLGRILAQLRAKAPDLADLFADFVSDLRNFTDWTRPRIWTPSAQALIDIKDEKLLRSLPSNCTGSNQPDVVQLTQAVIRQQKPRIVQFQTDFAALKTLQSAPLQHSYLIVHEWLWDFTDDPEVIRWANRLLHSTTLEQMDATTLNASLNGIGIAMSGYGRRKICTRSAPILALIEENIGKRCEDITLEELDAFVPKSGYLDLRNQSLESLAFGDFASGFHRFGGLYLGGNLLSRISGGVFAGLRNVESLHLDENRLSTLPTNLFEELPQLKNLMLNSNLLTEIPPRYLAKASELYELDLSRNKIREVPVDLLSSIPRVKETFLKINLRGNPIKTLPKGLFSSAAPKFKGKRLLLLIGYMHATFSAEDLRRISDEISAAGMNVVFEDNR